MDISIIILIILGIVIAGFVIIYWRAIKTGGDKIFGGSGVPIDMAKTLLQSIFVSGQLFAGVAISCLVAILITKNYISPEVGIPVISVIVGYLIGRSFKA